MKRIVGWRGGRWSALADERGAECPRQPLADSPPAMHTAFQRGTGA